MSLVNCRRCRTSVSVSAYQCPKCGELVDEQARREVGNTSSYSAAPASPGKPSKGGTGIFEVQFDPSVIRAFAAALYSQAKTIVAVSTGMGILIGLIAGFALKAIVGQNHIVLMVLFALLGGLFGYFLAQARAFQLKLLAQQALCHVAIEANTRRTSERVAVLSNVVEDEILRQKSLKS